MDITNPNNSYANRSQALHVYSSPLPPPEALAKYEQIQPGLTQKIIKLTEIQGNHRRKLEAKHLDAQISHQKKGDNEAKLGQILAFIIAMFAIGGGLYVVLQGYQVAGAIIGTIGLSGIITPFVIGKYTKPNE